MTGVLAKELLTQIYELQRRFQTGNWSFDGTIYSKTLYKLAARHKMLRNSPVAGKKNIERNFEARLAKTMKQLVSQKLCVWRKIKSPSGPAKFALGYKNHKSRNRDIFLTDHGQATAEKLLREMGLMAEEQKATCQELPAPKGPIAGGLAGCDE